MYLIVGLGNPGKEYEQTYHNAGFLCLDEIAKTTNTKFSKRECNAFTAHCHAGLNKLILVKPATYMNLSGFCVSALLSKYKLSPSQLLVIYDDIDLPLGSIRIRQQGSGGTHNGMRNIIEQLNSTEFARIRIGIGTNCEKELRDFVLSKISEENMIALSPAIAKAAKAAQLIASGISITQINEQLGKCLI